MNVSLFRHAASIVLPALFLLGAALARADGPETEEMERVWDALLADHVRPGRIAGVALNLVDYAAIAADARWEPLLAALAAAEEPAEASARKAFWLNAYNILAIKVVLSKYPVASIKDVGGWVTSVWKIDAGVAAGRTLSLDTIEHQIVRPMGDPLVHAGLVCASVGCPDLRGEAYRAERVDAQLAEQMRAFLANDAKGARLSDDGATLTLSPIFDWFGGDFERDGGTLGDFLVAYAPAPIAKKLRDGKLEMRFFDYDWSLNDTARGAKD